MLPRNAPPKFNSSPLKNGGWKTSLSYWEGNFSGAMLNFGKVSKIKPRNWNGVSRILLPGCNDSAWRGGQADMHSDSFSSKNLIFD